MHCGMAYESVCSLVRDHVIRVWVFGFLCSTVFSWLCGSLTISTQNSIGMTMCFSPSHCTKCTTCVIHWVYENVLRVGVKVNVLPLYQIHSCMRVVKCYSFLLIFFETIIQLSVLIDNLSGIRPLLRYNHEGYCHH